MHNRESVSPLKKAEEIDMNRVIEAVAHMTGRSVGAVRDTWLIAREEAGGNVKTKRSRTTIPCGFPQSTSSRLRPSSPGGQSRIPGRI